MNDLILYTTEDGRSQIKLRARDQTVWLSQREMAQLFDVSTDNAGLHLKNIFADGETGGEFSYRGILGNCRRRQKLPYQALQSGCHSGRWLPRAIAAWPCGMGTTGTTFRNSITFDGLFSEIDLGPWKFAQAWLNQRLTEA